MIKVLKDGVCPFTKKPYDCGKCEAFENLELPEGVCSIHICLYFGDAIRDGKRGINWLHKMVGKKDYTKAEVEEYFTALFRMGADHVPFGEPCDRFCFRRGCMGHPKEGEAK
jgi:hypothetical protein